MPPRLVLACVVPASVQARARTEFDAVVADTEDMTIDQVIETTNDRRSVAVVVTSAQKFAAPVIARLPDSMRVIATSSVGFDHIDIEASRARGIMATNTPEVLTECTADLTFLLILAACRRAHEYETIMRAGWRRRCHLADTLGVRVNGKTLGIVGMGRIGQAVARRARGFGMHILYADQRRLPSDREDGAVFFADLRAMLPQCDILTLHAPGGAETNAIMNAETFALLPKGAVFVNVARGSLVDEEALLDALRSGHLFAAGLDVFRNEPAFDLRFAELPNVFLTPHMGSATLETRTAMGNRALDNAAAVCAGRRAIDPLWN
jgi:hydroxypyruvate reductase